MQLLVNSLTYETTSHYEYFQPYFDYLKKLSEEFKIEVETELKIYDIKLFGDHLHVNEEGAIIYTKQLKEKYKI